MDLLFSRSVMIVQIASIDIGCLADNITTTPLPCSGFLLQLYDLLFNLTEIMNHAILRE